MILIYRRLVINYLQDKSLSLLHRDDMVLPYYEKMSALLEPLSLCVDLDAANRVESLSKDQIDEIFKLLSETGRSIAVIRTHNNEFDVAENHFQRAIPCAKRYNEEGEIKTTLLLEALKNYRSFLIIQGNYADGVPLSDEAYNYVAIAYNPVHPQVQEAAGILIDCLMDKGDLYDAERFGQLTLDSLRDPANKVDQQSEAVARGYFNLGRVIYYQKGDLVRAENLARAQLNGNDPYRVGKSVSLLADILRNQGNLGDEVKELYERCLAIYVKEEGPDGINTLICNSSLGHFHRGLVATILIADKRMKHLQLSKSYYTEASRIFTKVFSPGHHDTIQAASDLSEIYRELSEA